MKFDKNFYYTTEEYVLNLPINKLVDETTVPGILEFYDLMYIEFKNYLIEHKEEILNERQKY